jgi:hypothetical protein
MIRPSFSGQQPERMLSDPKPVLYREVRRNTSWRRGAAGERRTARWLGRLPRDGYVVLHDLALPGSPANVDCDDSRCGGRGEV